MDKIKRAEFMKGLEYLVEAHCASDAVEPAYVCTVCEWWLCQAHNVLEHVASKRHRKSYLDSVKNTFDSVTSAFLERCDLHKAARIYEELYARKTVGLMFTRSFGRALLTCRDMPACRINDPTIACKPPQLHIPALESAISIGHAAIVPALSNEDLMRMPTRHFAVTEKCYARVVFETYADPLIGLEAVIEMQTMDEKRQPGYFCKTCVSRHNSTVAIVRHLTSVVHRWAYLSLPQHADDSELAELLKCGPEDKDGIAEAAKYFEDRRGRQCVSLTFMDRFDGSICNSLRRADPSDLSTKKTRREWREQQRKQESASVSDFTAPNRVSTLKRKATDEEVFSSSLQIKRNPIDAEAVVSKRVKDETPSAACNGTFEISAPALPASKPYVGLFPPKLKGTQGGVTLSKAAGDFSIVKKNIVDHESGPVEQGVVQQTGRHSWDTLDGQFLSGSAAATSVVSSAASFAGFPHDLPASGPFHPQSQPTANRFSSSSSTVSPNGHDQFSSTVPQKMADAPHLSVVSPRFFSNSSLISSSINGLRAFVEPQPGFLAGPPIPAPQTTVAFNSNSPGAMVSFKNRASTLGLDDFSRINNGVRAAHEHQAGFWACPTISAPQTAVVASNSNSPGEMVAFKSNISAPELDDLSLINDAINTADAALHECSAEQLVALLLAERKAVEAQDRLIAKLANELLEKEIV